MTHDYDADEILAKMRDDTQHDWPARLLHNMFFHPASGNGARSNVERGLTPYELRVLTALSHGVGTDGAAQICGVTVETIKTQSKSARAKLAAKNTTHAVAIALRLGLIR